MLLESPLKSPFFGRWKCQSVPHVFYLVLCVLSTPLICRQLEAEMHESKQVKQWRLRCQRSSTLGWRKVWSKSMKGPVILKWCSNMFKPSTLADLYTESLGLWSFVKQTLNNLKQPFIVYYHLLSFLMNCFNPKHLKHWISTWALLDFRWSLHYQIVG